MRKLTIREKVLVYIAFILVLGTICYYFLEAPAYSRLMEKQDQLAVLKLQEQEKGSNVKTVTQLELEIEEEEQVLNKQLELYPEYRGNSALVPQITAMLEQYGLVPLELAVDTAETVNAAGGEESIRESIYPVFDITLTIAAAGTEDDYYRFLDMAAEQIWLKVTACHWEDEESQIALTVVCTMHYPKASPSQGVKVFYEVTEEK